MDKKRPLCVAPFLGFYYKGNSSPDRSFEGRFRTCCESRTGVDELGNKVYRDITLKDVTDVHDVMESDHFKKVRSKLMAGEWHECCFDCRYREEIGIVNSRENYGVVADRVEKLYPEIEYNVETGNNLNKLFWLDYRPSNLCNLKCRMCSPYNSSLFAEEVNSLPQAEKKHYLDVLELGFNPDDMYDKTRDKDVLHGVLNLEDVVYLKILGGEPLFMKEPREMIRKVGPNAEVVITTNATKIDDDFIHLFETRDVNRFHFQISLDGIEDTYEYIRYPGKWNKVETNIKRLYQLNAKSRITIGTTFVIQMWNVFQIPDIVEWSIGFFRHFSPKPRGAYFSIVTQKWLHINLLTQEHQDWLLGELYELKDRLVMTDLEVEKYIRPIEKMLAVELTPELRAEYLERFRQATDEFDFRRDQDILSLDSRYGEYV